MLEDTLAWLAPRGLFNDVEEVHLDKDYDYLRVDELLVGLGLEGDIRRRRKQGERERPRELLGPRWVVERTSA